MQCGRNVCECRQRVGRVPGVMSAFMFSSTFSCPSVDQRLKNAGTQNQMQKRATTKTNTEFDALKQTRQRKNDQIFDNVCDRWALTTEKTTNPIKIHLFASIAVIARKRKPPGLWMFAAAFAMIVHRQPS